MPPGHTKVDGWLDFKRTLWHLSQARLNIQEELYGCATGQTQGYTHAWPLALVLRFISKRISKTYCVYMYVSRCTCVGQRAACDGLFSPSSL